MCVYAFAWVAFVLFRPQDIPCRCALAHSPPTDMRTNFSRREHWWTGRQATWPRRLAGRIRTQ